MYRLLTKNIDTIDGSKEKSKTFRREFVRRPSSRRRGVVAYRRLYTETARPSSERRPCLEAPPRILAHALLHTHTHTHHMQAHIYIKLQSDSTIKK